MRIISATNAPLEERIQTGEFRQDLYYRLRVVELTVPPLRERGQGDIERLAEHFLDLYARRHRRQARRLSPQALARLQTHDWPGNVRELEHCIQSAVVLAPGDVIIEDQLSLPGHSQTTSPAPGYRPGLPLRQVEQDHIKKTLAAVDGNRSQAAQLLGIGRNTLARKLKE